ncbi:hypothetical protein B296_00035034, partial [Ensete ventricosum]
SCPIANRPISGTVGGSTSRVGSARLLATNCQGYCSLVGLTCMLCHVVNRLSSGALSVCRPDISTLIYCQQLAIRGSTGLPIDPPEVGLALGVRPTCLKRDVVDVGVRCSGVGGPATIDPII